jgi:hypothetical protein
MIAFIVRELAFDCELRCLKCDVVQSRGSYVLEVLIDGEKFYFAHIFECCSGVTSVPSLFEMITDTGVPILDLAASYRRQKDVWALPLISDVVMRSSFELPFPDCVCKVV